jgi:hypothetical protein
MPPPAQLARCAASHTACRRASSAAGAKRARPGARRAAPTPGLLPRCRYCREQHGLKCFRRIWKAGQQLEGPLSAEEAAAALQDFAPQELRYFMTAVLVAAL